MDGHHTSSLDSDFIQTILVWLVCSSSNTADLNLAGITTLIFPTSNIQLQQLTHFYVERMASNLGSHTVAAPLYKVQHFAVALFKRSAFTGRVLTCDTLNRVAGEVFSDSVDGR